MRKLTFAVVFGVLGGAMAMAAPGPVVQLVNPVCVHQLGMLGAPVAPGGDFVQVFVSGVEADSMILITLRVVVEGKESTQYQIAIANQHGAVAIFHVDGAAMHKAPRFSAEADLI